MKLKSVIDSPCGLRYCFENLELQSGYSRKFLLNTEFMTHKGDIEASYRDIDRYISVLGKSENKALLQTIQYKLQGVKDIEQTILNIAQNQVLDDIELFEVKHLSMLSEDLSKLLENVGIDSKIDSNVSKVTDILDPQGLRIATFYVYDAYSAELAAIRKKINGLEPSDEREDLLAQSLEIEAKVRWELSSKLVPYSELLLQTLQNVAKIDIAIAKGIQMEKMGLTFPIICDGESSLEGMFNPQVKELLEVKGDKYQNINITYGASPVLVIGANMGGKTVVIKTLALCQYLMQFGFGVPASKACLSIKDEVCLVAGDGQDITKGLSSFAAEMKGIDNVVRMGLGGENILALIDEPARSTNPIEGTALVSSLIKVLSECGVSMVVTTHYNIDVEGCVRLKVKGLEGGKMNYELCVTPSGMVPHEALSVAESLGISSEWLNEAKKLLITI